MRHGRAVAVLVTLVAASLLTACGAGRPGHRAVRHPAPPTTAPTTTAPPTTALHLPPVASPLPAGSAVPGATVGPVSFVDDMHGFGLYTLPAAASSRQQLVASDDGGATWHTVGDTVLPAYVSELTFVDATHGYAWGSVLEVTSDGGVQWSTALTSVVGTPEGVSPIGGDVWALTSSCPSSAAATSPCSPGLETSADGGATWRPTAALPVTDATAVSRVDADTAYVLGCPAPGAGGTGGLARTEDAGAQWQVLSLPQGCSTAVFDYDLVAVSVDDLWLVAFGQPATDMSSKWVYRSFDGGLHWTLEASFVLPSSHPTGRIPAVGDEGPLSVLAADPDRAWLALDRGGLLVTTDGGADWAPAFPDPEADAFGADAVSFLDAVHGWAATFHGLWRTTDGTHWVDIAPLPASAGS